MEPGLRESIGRGAASVWGARGLVLGLWGAGAAAGIVSAAPWAGAWVRALRHTGSGHDLARGFDLVLLGDLLREAGPGLGALRGWGGGAGAAYLLLMAILQGGTLQVLLAPGKSRSRVLFGEGCAAHAGAMLALAALSVLAAAACALAGCGFLALAGWVALDAVESGTAVALRAAGVAVALLLFAGAQVVLDLARLERVSGSSRAVPRALAAAARFAARRALACLLAYAAASALSLLALLACLALARAAGALPWGWGIGTWAAAQIFLLVRWGCRACLWGSLGALRGLLPSGPE